MAVGFRARYRTADGTLQGERILYQLPIRFGRNVLNHCQIVHPYISDFHAVVELVDGRLCIRDLQSKNGVYTPSGERITANMPFDLSATGNAFLLGGAVQVHVETFEQNRDVGERMSATRGAVLGNRAALQSGPVEHQSNRSQPPDRPVARPLHPGASSPYEVEPLPPLSADVGAPAARPPYVPGASSPPWNGAMSGGSQEGRDLPALAPLPGRDPRFAPGSRPQAAPPLEPRGVSRSTQHFSMGLEMLAMLGLRELAESLVPGIPLQTTGDVARLLTKLHDTVEVFCRCFVPLREGYSQFVSSMDLRRAASQRSVNRSRSALAVDLARDPPAVAAALLDWRNQDFDAPEVVEGIFADLMIHQVALIESVMRGVHALLEELSPERIEGLLREQRPGSLALVMGRYRALWKTFQAHYEELADETRTFELVFGPEFAASYRDYLARTKKPVP